MKQTRKEKEDLARVSRLLLNDMKTFARAGACVFSEPLPVLKERLYVEIGRDKRDLTMTTTLVEVWAAVCESRKNQNYLEELENLVIEKAKEEWGSHTVVEFDRSRGVATVRNSQKAKKKIINDFEFGETSSDGPGDAA